MNILHLKRLIDWNLIALLDELFWQLVREDRSTNNALRQAVVR